MQPCTWMCKYLCGMRQSHVGIYVRMLSVGSYHFICKIWQFLSLGVGKVASRYSFGSSEKVETNNPYCGTHSGNGCDILPGGRGLREVAVVHSYCLNQRTEFHRTVPSVLHPLTLYYCLEKQWCSPPGCPTGRMARGKEGQGCVRQTYGQ